MSKQNTSVNVGIHIHEVKKYKLFIYLRRRPAVLGRSRLITHQNWKLPLIKMINVLFSSWYSFFLLQTEDKLSM